MDKTSKPEPTNARCLKCKRAIADLHLKFFPFCSERCKLVDLSGWLNEDFGLPYEDVETTEARQLADLDIETEK